MDFSTGDYIVKAYAADGSVVFQIEANEIGRHHPLTGLPYAVEKGTGHVISLVASGPLAITLTDVEGVEPEGDEDDFSDDGLDEFDDEEESF